VELEMLGPLRKLSAGESTEKTVTYKFLQLPKRSLFGGAAANSVIA